MPVRVVSGNLFDSGAEALVNPVNCVGVAGRGLAKTFRDLYPGAFEAYRFACNQGLLRPGKGLAQGAHLLVPKPGLRTPGVAPKWLLCAATKDDWRQPSEQAFATGAARWLADEANQRGLRTMAVPALGCGLGGLPWETLRPLLVAELERATATEVSLYAPG